MNLYILKQILMGYIHSAVHGCLQIFLLQYSLLFMDVYRYSYFNTFCCSWMFTDISMDVYRYSYFNTFRCSCMFTDIPTSIHSAVHAYLQIFLLQYIPLFMHVYRYSYFNTFCCSCMFTDIPTSIHSAVHACLQIFLLQYIPLFMDVYRYSYFNTFCCSCIFTDIPTSIHSAVHGCLQIFLLQYILLFMDVYRYSYFNPFCCSCMLGSDLALTELRTRKDPYWFSVVCKSMSVSSRTCHNLWVNDPIIRSNTNWNQQSPQKVRKWSCIWDITKYSFLRCVFCSVHCSKSCFYMFGRIDCMGGLEINTWRRWGAGLQMCHRRSPISHAKWEDSSPYNYQ